MRRPSDRAWWLLLLIAVTVVAVWPPQTGRSLALKATNWLVDPGDTLPILPPQLGFGMGDDVAAVETRDEMVRRYDAMYSRGGLTKLRMDLKVAQDPFAPTTARQLLLVFGVVAAFLVWRAEGEK